MASATGLAQSDTIYYFDCADSIPGNWQSLDSTGNNFSWEHTYVGLDAAYCPLSSSSFNSTSANNGWLMLHSAYHNTDSTGGTLEMADTIIYMNSTLLSDPFDFSNESEVYVSFQHWYRTLSAPMWGSFDMAVSNDGISWTTFNMNTGPDSPDSGWEDKVEIILIDISTIAAGQTQVWLRFHYNNLAWYFWNIDDIAFLRSTPPSAIESDIIANFKIFPNPVEKGAFINVLNARTGSTYELLDCFGAIVSSGKLQNSNSKIQLNGIGVGIYFLNINNYVEKIVVR
jgi:hypothetical protein